MEQAMVKFDLYKETIARAKRLGSNPKSLMKRLLNKSELW